MIREVLKGFFCATAVLGGIYYFYQTAWILKDIFTHPLDILTGIYEIPSIDPTLIYSFIGWVILMFLLFSLITFGKKRDDKI